MTTRNVSAVELRAISLQCDLAWRAEGHVRLAAIDADESGDANAAAEILLFGLAELCPGVAPDDYSKNLAWVGTVKIEKCCAAAASRGEVRARHQAADGCGFAYMVVGLLCRERLRFCRARTEGRSSCQANCQRY